MKTKIWAFIGLLCSPAPALAMGEGEVSKQKIKEARTLLYDQKYQEALARFEEVLKSDPSSLEAQLGKMDCLGGLRKRDEITSLAQKQGAGDSVDALIISAHGKIWNRDYQGAIADLNKAVAKNADAYLAHYLLGYVKYRSKENEAAIDHLQAAIKANADFPETYYLLGDLYFRQGNSEKVFENWRAYLKRIPRTGNRYEFVSSTLQKMGGN